MSELVRREIAADQLTQTLCGHLLFLDSVSMMLPAMPPPSKAYLLEKKSGGIAEIKHRGLKEKIPVIKHLGGGGGDDDDLNGRAPIRAVLQKVDDGLKKITGSITDLLGDNLGGLLDNLLKKVYSFVKKNALELVKTLLRELVHCGGLFESLEACAILGPTPRRLGR